MTTEKELIDALIIAAKALEIADDWNLHDVQVYPPKEWKLLGCEQNPNEGWCGTYSLAKKLRELAACEYKKSPEPPKTPWLDQYA